ncbi:MAG: helix-turn-helix domain-containing protein [Planctomycetaceae bacterium]|nr:helix-turn-helix domain-containing protein [Planctomycetaceae bacterium]
MDDTRCRDFFSHPAGTLQRRYEALRAVFIDHRPQRQVAEQFGYTYDSLRQLVHEFRSRCRRDAPPPFFSPSPAGDPTARPNPSPPPNP